MNFSSHAKAGGVLAAATFGVNYLFSNSYKIAAMCAGLVFIGSIFPDLDTESIPSRWAARAGFIFSLACVFWFKTPLPAAIVGALFFLIKSGSHRGFTHKYYFPILSLIIGFSNGNFLYLAFASGLLCHFWLDRISPFDGKNWF